MSIGTAIFIVGSLYLLLRFKSEISGILSGIPWIIVKKILRVGVLGLLCLIEIALTINYGFHPPIEIRILGGCLGILILKLTGDTWKNILLLVMWIVLAEGVFHLCVWSFKG